MNAITPIKCDRFVLLWICEYLKFLFQQGKQRSGLVTEIITGWLVF